jgi:Mg2+/Co2+ transporter CorB
MTIFVVIFNQILRRSAASFRPQHFILFLKRILIIFILSFGMLLSKFNFGFHLSDY